MNAPNQISIPGGPAAANTYGNVTVDGLRKSQRVPRPPQQIYVPATPKTKPRRATPSRLDPATKPQRGFLALIYQEVHNVALGEPINGNWAAVQDLIRFARFNRFLRMLRAGRRQTYLTSIRNFNHPLRRLDAKVKAILPDFPALTRYKSRRLDQFVDNLGYPLLCICAHSRTFRDALTKPDRNAPNNLFWNLAFQALSNNASSLEFFAKIRGIDIHFMFHACDPFFKFLVKYPFQGLLPQDGHGGLTQNDFGTNSGRMSEWHEHHPNAAAGLDPHLYPIPVEDAEPEPCTLTYTVSRYLQRDEPTKILNAPETLDQNGIAESVVLEGGYTWPLRDDWPERDPRYAGFEGDPCIV